MLFSFPIFPPQALYFSLSPASMRMFPHLTFHSSLSALTFSYAGSSSLQRTKELFSIDVR